MIHVYDTEKSRPVAVILRPGKTPSGVEVRAHLRRLVRRIRARWPLSVRRLARSKYVRALLPHKSPRAQPMAPEWDRKEPAAIQVAGFQVISENGRAN